MAGLLDRQKTLTARLGARGDLLAQRSGLELENIRSQSLSTGLAIDELREAQAERVRAPVEGLKLLSQFVGTSPAAALGAGFLAFDVDFANFANSRIEDAKSRADLTFRQRQAERLDTQARLDIFKTQQEAGSLGESLELSQIGTELASKRLVARERASDVAMAERQRLGDVAAFERQQLISDTSLETTKIRNAAGTSADTAAALLDEQLRKDISISTADTNAVLLSDAIADFSDINKEIPDDINLLNDAITKSLINTGISPVQDAEIIAKLIEDINAQIRNVGKIERRFFGTGPETTTKGIEGIKQERITLLQDAQTRLLETAAAKYGEDSQEFAFIMSQIAAKRRETEDD